MTNEELCTLQQSGDSDAGTRLIEQNEGFLFTIANEYARRYPICLVDEDDFVQEGSMALLRAASSYSPERGCNFLTYAAVAIRNAITDVIRKAYPKLPMETPDDEPNSDAPWPRPEYSLSSLNSYHESPEQILIRKEELHEIHTAMENTPLRENVWVRQRFGFDDEPCSLATCAKRFHLSESRTKYMENLALSHIRENLRGHRFTMKQAA